MRIGTQANPIYLSSGDDTSGDSVEEGFMQQERTNLGRKMPVPTFEAFVFRFLLTHKGKLCRLSLQGMMGSACEMN